MLVFSKTMKDKVFKELVKQLNMIPSPIKDQMIAFARRNSYKVWKDYLVLLYKKYSKKEPKHLGKYLKDLLWRIKKIERKSNFGKKKIKRKSKMSKKVPESLKKKCRKLKVRLTVKSGKKRVYKSEKVLKKQCKTAMKKKVKRKRKFGAARHEGIIVPQMSNGFGRPYFGYVTSSRASRFGSRRPEFHYPDHVLKGYNTAKTNKKYRFGRKLTKKNNKNSIMNTLGKHKIKIALGTLGVGGIGFSIYAKRQLEKGSVYMVMIPHLDKTYKLGVAYRKDYTGMFSDNLVKLLTPILTEATHEYFLKFDPTNRFNDDVMEKWVKYNKIKEMFQDTFEDGFNGNEPKHINKGEKFLDQNLLGMPIRLRLEVLLWTSRSGGFGRPHRHPLRYSYYNPSKTGKKYRFGKSKKIKDERVRDFKKKPLTKEELMGLTLFTGVGGIALGHGGTRFYDYYIRKPSARDFTGPLTGIYDDTIEDNQSNSLLNNEGEDFGYGKPFLFGKKKRKKKKGKKKK